MFANKKIFKNKDETHIGINAPEGYVETTIEDVKGVLSNLGKRRLWRCFVCNDLHIGISFPTSCPTCIQEDAYCEITLEEIKNMLEI